MQEHHEQATAAGTSAIAGTPATARLVTTEETLATVDIPRTSWTNNCSRDAIATSGVYATEGAPPTADIPGASETSKHQQGC